MSDDLVKRLREVGGMSDDGATRWYINPDGPEAASRIEKLETALREIIDIHPFKDPEGDASVKAVVDLMFRINLTARRAINTF